MKYENEVSYKITTSLDKTGIAQLQAQLKQLETQMHSKAFSGNRLYTEANAAKDIANIKKLSSALSQAYSGKTGLLNLNKFNDALTRQQTNVGILTRELNNMGVSGQKAVNSLISQTLTFQQGIRQTTTMGEQLRNTLGNTVRWGLVSSAFQEVMNSVQQATVYIKKLDESLTNITMVSGETRDNMKEFAQYANKAAAQLGAATTTYTNATKVFVQEGFTLEQAKPQAQQAVTLANISEQDSATTADQITAYRNAMYGVDADINLMNQSLDKIANIANSTASSVGELMTATQRSASTAKSVGASEDTYLASVATVQAITRESAETVGNGLKSIYTRFADIQAGGSTEDGVGYGKYAKTLKAAGVDVLDATGEFRGFDAIFSDLQDRWEDLSDTMKVAVGETVAGRYQYNRFATLMNNQEYYDKAYAATQNADGTFERMQEDYMEGLRGQLQRIATNFESLFTAIYKTGVVEDVVKAFADLSSILSKLFENLDNGTTIVAAFVAILTKLGGNAMATGFANMMANRDQRRIETQNEAMRQNIAMQLSQNGNLNKDQKALVDTLVNTTKFNGLYSDEEKEQIKSLATTQADAISKKAALTERRNTAITGLTPLLSKYGVDPSNSAAVAGLVNRLDDNEIKKAQKAGKEEYKKATNRANVLQAIKDSGTLPNGQADFNKIQTELTAAREKGTLSGSVYKNIARQIEGFKNSADGGIKALKLLDQALKNETTTAEKNRAAAELSSKEFINMAQSVEKDSAALAKLNSQVKTNKEALNDLTDKTIAANVKTVADGVNKAANAVMALSMLMSTMKGIYSTITDETTSMTDKIVNLTSQIAMLGIIAAPAVIDLVTNFKSLKGNVLKFKDAVINLFGPFKVQIAIIMAVVGALLAVKAAMEAFEVHSNKMRTAFEVQQSSLTGLRNSVTSLTASYNTLKSSWSDYSSAKETLDSMTRGTQEWNEAVMNVNQSVMTLLEKYPQLIKYVNNNSGVLEINEEGYNTLLEEQSKKIASMTNAAMVEQIEADAAQNLATQEEIFYTNAANGKIKGVVSVQDDVVPNQNVLVESMPMKKYFDNAIDKLVEIYKESPEDFAYTSSAFKQVLLDSNIDINDDEVLEKMQSLVKSIVDNTNATVQLADAYGGVTETDDEFINDIGHQLYINKFGATQDIIGDGYYVTGQQKVDKDFKTLINEGNTEAAKWLANELGEEYVNKTIEEVRTKGGVLQAKVDGDWKDTSYKSSEAARDAFETSLGAQFWEGVSSTASEGIIKYFGGNIEEGLGSVKWDESNKYYDSEETLYGEDGLININAVEEQIGAMTERFSWNEEEALAATQILINQLQDYLDNNPFRASLSFNENIYEGYLKELGLEDEGESEAFAELSGDRIGTGYYIDKYQNRQSKLQEQINKIESEIDYETWDELGPKLDSLKQKEAEAAEKAEEFTEAQNILAQETARSQVGFNNLAKSVEDYQNKINSDNLFDQSEALASFQNSLSDLSGLEASVFDLDWIQKHKDTFAKAIEGDKKKVEELYDLMGQKALESYGLDTKDMAAALTKFADAIQGGAKYNSSENKSATEEYLKNAEENGVVNAEKLDQLISVAQANGIAITGVEYSIEGVDDTTEVNGKETQRTYASYSEAQNRINEIIASNQNTILSMRIQGTTDAIRTGTQQIVAAVQNQELTLNAMSAYGDAIKVDENGKLSYNENAGIKLDAEGTKALNSYLDSVNNNEGDTTPADKKVDAAFNKLVSEANGMANRLKTSAKIGDGSSTYTGAQSVSGQKDNKKGGKSGKDADKNIDPYLQINEQLKKQETYVNRLSKAYDNLYGSKRLSAMQKYRDALKKQNKYLRTQAKISREQLKELTTKTKDPDTDNYTVKYYNNYFKKNLRTAAQKKKGTTLYNSDGSINQTVYEKIYNALYKKNNADALKAFEKAISDYEKSMENVQSYLDGLIEAHNKYVESIAAEHDYVKELKDRYYELADSQQNLFSTMTNGFDRFTSSLDKAIASSKINAKAAETSREAYNDAFKEQADIQEQINKMQTATVKYGGKTYSYIEAQNILSTLKANKNTSAAAGKLESDLDKVAKADDIRFTSLDAANEALVEAVQNTNSKMEETINSIADKLNSEFDKLDGVLDGIDGHISRFATLASDIGSAIDVINTLDSRSNESLDQQNSLYKQQYAAYGQQLKNYKYLEDTATLTAEELQKKAVSARANGDTETVKRLEDAAQTYFDKAEEARGSSLSVLKESNDALENIKNNNIQIAMNTLTTALGIRDLTNSNLKWEIATENAEDYYDDYERTYQLNNLEYQYNSLKNAAKNVKIQNQITNAMNKQMKFLRESSKLSKYNVEYALKQLEVLKAQIALEESQKNKTQLNLVRDSAGNYSYVYTADQEAVDEAQNNLAKAQQDAYEYAKSSLMTTREGLVQDINTTISRLQNAQLTEEDKNVILQGFKERFAQRANLAQSQVSDLKTYGVDNMADLGLMFEDDIINALTNGNFNTIFGSSINDFTNSVTSILNSNDAAQASIEAEVKTISKSITNYLGDSTKTAKDWWEAATTSISGIKTVVDDIYTLLQGYSQTLKEAESVYNRNQELTTQASYQATAAETQNATKDVRKATVSKLNSDIASSQIDFDSQTTFGKTTSTLEAGDIGYLYAKSLNLYKNKALNKKGIVATQGDHIQVVSIDDKAGITKVVDRDKDSKSKYYLKTSTLQAYLIGYDSGGYTGDWSTGSGLDNKNGKLALLHQKELVLNSEDTANMLSAIEILREMQTNLHDYGNNYTGKFMTSDNDKTIEQRVEITATFPAAKDAGEIRSALLQIADTAYQYAN